MEFFPGEETVEEGSESPSRYVTYDIGRLKDAGVDTDTGMKYCANDEDLYFEMLFDFVLSYKGKLEESDRLFCNEDWHGYRVQVHALKSNGRMIGLNDVYEQAKALEEAAAGEKIGSVKANHLQFLRTVREAALHIQNAQIMEAAKRPGG